MAKGDDGGRERGGATGSTAAYRGEERSRFRRPGSRLCHGLLGIIFFLMMAVTIVALGLFAAKHNKVDDKFKEGEGSCILYTTKYNPDSPKLSNGVGCSYTMWGSGVVAVGLGIFVFGYLFKTVYGASLTSCLVCLELPILLILFILSLSVGINTSLGLGLACKAFIKAEVAGECKDVNVNGVKFFEDMLVSGIMSWSVTGALLFTVVFYIGLNMVFCRRCTKSRDDEDASETLLERETDKKEKKKNKKEKKKKKVDLIKSDSNNPFLDT